MADALTVSAALAAAQIRLAALGADANREARLLLRAATQLDGGALEAGPERPLDAAQARRYEDFVARRARGEPFAYIVGRREFWSLELLVSPAVLVPRPETELLVERLLQWSGTDDLLDLGTGCGAIALAAASERPAWHITATDLSAAALEVAMLNAGRLGLHRVEFLQGSWFDAVPGRRFGAIVSNPPYVGELEPEMQGTALLHEPRLALTPGRDALAALRSIIADSPDFLRSGGHLALEHGATQAGAVRELLVARGFRHVRSYPDLAGLLRVTEGQWAPASPQESSP